MEPKAVDEQNRGLVRHAVQQTTARHAFAPGSDPSLSDEFAVPLGQFREPLTERPGQLPTEGRPWHCSAEVRRPMRWPG